MTHSRVDRIMKKVEEYHRGDFVVNDDWEYSQTLAKKYRAQYANRFNGTNGVFTTGRMSCTEGCAREEDRIRIPAGGTVFGPYFAFPAGDYTAVYELSGDLRGCAVEAGCQTLGCIASGDAEALLQDGKVVLPFTLQVDVPDLELKTINRGDGEAVFNAVTVSGSASKTHRAEEAAQEAALPEMRPEIGPEEWPEEVAPGRVEERLRELQDMQRGSALAHQGLQVAAECTLPQRTRFRAVKRVFRKFMNSFITFQLDFNRRTAALFGDQSYQMQVLAAAVADEAEDVREKLYGRFDSLNRIIARQNEQISQLQEELRACKQARQEREANTNDTRRTEARLAALESDLTGLSRSVEDMEAAGVRLDQAERKLTGLSRMAVDLEAAGVRLSKVEADLQGLAESVNGSCANDDRLEEIGRLWARIEDAVRLLHERDQEKKAEQTNNTPAQGTGEVPDGETETEQTEE